MKDTEKRRIRVWLAQQGKSQEWLAGKVGISPSLLSLILSGRRIPSVAIAKQVYQLTNVKLYDAADAAELVGSAVCE